MVFQEGKPNDSSPDSVVDQLVLLNRRLLAMYRPGEPIKYQELFLDAYPEITEGEDPVVTKEQETIRAIDVLLTLREAVGAGTPLVHYYRDSNDEDHFWKIPFRELYVTEQYQRDEAGNIQKVTAHMTGTIPKRHLDLLTIIRSTVGNMDAESPATDTLPESRPRRWGSAFLNVFLEPMRNPPQRTRKR